MLNASATADTPRIFRLTLRRSDGRRPRRLVKCTFYQRDPQASLFGLQAKLAELTLNGLILGHSVSVPAQIKPRDREKLARWTDAIDGMLS